MREPSLLLQRPAWEPKERSPRTVFKTEHTDALPRAKRCGCATVGATAERAGARCITPSRSSRVPRAHKWISMGIGNKGKSRNPTFPPEFSSAAVTFRIQRALLLRRCAPSSL
ncbi:hypothetical protein MHYP_G00055050 [Metynnis hypsauchen]